MFRPSLVLSALLALACSAPRVVPERQDRPSEAAQYYASKRDGSTPEAYERARIQMKRMARFSTAATTADSGRPFERWSFLGPGNIGGRTRTLIFDHANPDIMYAGAVSGGIWKTYDAGARWEPVGDALTNIAVNALAMHPTDARVIYAGTGEGYFREEQRGTGLPLRGDGIFVTRDAGSTWTRLASTTGEDFHWVNDLIVTSSRIYAATRTGVWRSNDEGATWTRVLATSVKGGCLDLVARPDAEDYLFASCGTFQQATVYRAKSADAVWEPVLAEQNMGRTTLAIAPSNPSIIYALSASNQPGNYHQGLLAVFRSEQDGDSGSWSARFRNNSPDRGATLMLTNPIAAANSICGPASAQDFYITMGWYANAIAVDPVDANRIWTGGVDLFRSDDGGVTWGVASYWWRAPENNTSYVHADQHAILFHPRYDGSTNKTLFFATDGGVFRTDDATADPARGSQAVCFADSRLRFSALNHNYGATQFYHGAVYPDGRSFIAGAQDNGTLRGTTDKGTDGWWRVHGGDGGYVAVDPKDATFVYAESQGGRIVRSVNGGSMFADATFGLNDNFLFIAPFVIDPNETKRLWIGGSRMWRSEDRATNWSASSAFVNGQVSAIAVAPGNSDRVLAGTNRGDIYRMNHARSSSLTTNWPRVTPREGFVTSIAFSPFDANVAYATYGGFGGPHLFKSVDGGATWIALDANGALPDIPLHSIAIDPTRPGRLYLGTDLGVFVSLDDGLTWSVENTGFAAAVTETVLIAQGARGPAVYAFTHGRGAWRAELTLPGPRRRGVRH